MQKLAPDHDPRELCRLWHAWRKKRKLPPPHDPEAAFLGFVNAFVLRVSQAVAGGSKPPKPDEEHIELKALDWWTRLPENVRHDLEQRHRAYRIQDEDLFRSDKQLVEYCYRNHGPRRQP